MNIRHWIVVVALLAVFTSVTASAVTREEAEARLEEIASWGTMDGTWEGQYKIVFKPEGGEDPDTEIVNAKVVLSEGKASFYIALPGEEFSPVSEGFPFQANELFAKLQVVRSGGAWVESWMVDLSRESKNQAKLFLLRTVNNWAGEAPPTGSVFAVVGIGSFSRAE